MSPTEKSELLFPFREAEQFGLADYRSTRVFEPQFGHAWRSVEGVAVVRLTNGCFALVDARSPKIVEHSNWEPQHYAFSRGLLAVSDARSEPSRIGYMTLSGEIAIGPKFSIAGAFDRNGAIVKTNPDDRHVQRIDRNGYFVGEKFADIRPFHVEGDYSGAWPQEGNSQMVMIDAAGNRVGNRMFAAVWQEHGGLIPVQYNDNEIGWTDVMANDVYRIEATGVGNSFESGLVPVQLCRDKWGLMNRFGDWVVEPAYDIVEPVGPKRFMLGVIRSDESTCVRLSDQTGNAVGDDDFEWIGRYIDNFASVWRTDDSDVQVKNFVDLDGHLVFRAFS